MSIQLFINNTDLTEALQFQTLGISDAIGERSTCSFELADDDGSLASLLAVGLPMSVVSDGIIIFGGTVEPWKERHLVGSTARVYKIDCVDWHSIGDRHVVAETYVQVLAGAIVRDLVDKYLAADGVTYTVDSIQDGPVVVECVFNYTLATNCLDGLAEKAGYSWWMGADKVLHFCERASYAAPWALDEASLVDDVTDLEVDHHRQGYRNRQYVKAGKDVTDPQAESFKGDGANRTFTVGFPIAKVPTIEISINGGAWVAQTVGIKGIDEGKQWYWNKGDATITQDPTGTLLTSNDKVRVTYQGFFDVVILTTDEAAIDARKAIEGGSGHYDAVEDEPYLSSREAAIQSGNAKLRRYAKMSEAITFGTARNGLRPGQILTADLAARGLNGDYLIEQIEFAQMTMDGWQYAVKAVSGEALGGWARFFKNMASRGQTWVIRENIREDQVLIRLVQSQEGWLWDEDNVPTVFSCPIPSDNLYPSDTLIPC